jgi:hypothetical protein
LHLAVAVNFKRKSAEIQSASPSATATLANAEPAVSLARRRAFLASPWPSRAMARSLSGLETKAEDSSSPSALNAGQRSSTSRKGMNKRSPSLSGPSRTHTFQPQGSRSTRTAGIPGSLFPTMSSTGVRIRYSPAPSGRVSTSCPGLTHTRHHYILWCCIDMRPVWRGSRPTIAHRMAAARPGRMRERFRTSPASRSQPAEPEQEVLVYQGN